MVFPVGTSTHGQVPIVYHICCKYLNTPASCKILLKLQNTMFKMEMYVVTKMHFESCYFLSSCVIRFLK